MFHQVVVTGIKKELAEFLKNEKGVDSVDLCGDDTLEAVISRDPSWEERDGAPFWESYIIPLNIAGRDVIFRIAECMRENPREFQVIAMKGGGCLSGKEMEKYSDKSQDYDILFSLPIHSTMATSLSVFKIKAMEKKVFEILRVDISRDRNVINVDIGRSVFLVYNREDKNLYLEDFFEEFGFLSDDRAPIWALLEKYNHWRKKGESIPIFRQDSSYKPERQLTLLNGVA